MKKYISNLFLGLLLVFLLDLVLGSLLKYFYFNEKSGLHYRTTYSINHVVSDVLAYGSSRANHHYDSRVFEKTLNKTFYNTGRDGNFIFYQTAVLKSQLQRFSPKVAILDFSGTFEYKEEDYDRLSSLLPYYESGDTTIKDIVDMRSPFEWIKNLSKIYPYNSSLITILVGNLEFNNSRAIDYNGYVPQYKTWEKKIQYKEKLEYYEKDKNKIEKLEEFIKLCKTNKIDLFIVYSPIYYNYNKDYTLELLNQICEQEGVYFFDFSKQKTFLTEKALFSDPTHLNNKGATLFSKMLSDSIKKYSKLNYQTHL